MLKKNQQEEEEEEVEAELFVDKRAWVVTARMGSCDLKGLTERAMLRCENEGTTVLQSHKFTNSLLHRQTFVYNIKSYILFPTWLA